MEKSLEEAKHEFDEFWRGLTYLPSWEDKVEMARWLVAQIKDRMNIHGDITLEDLEYMAAETFRMLDEDEELMRRNADHI
jgi:hypothetical protein